MGWTVAGFLLPVDSCCSAYRPALTCRGAFRRFTPKRLVDNMPAAPRVSPRLPSVSAEPITGATSLAWVLCTIVYTVKQNESGLWSVSSLGVTLADGLQLGPAIKRARNAARAEHVESGLTTRVEMHEADAIMPLANYQVLQHTWTGATA
jgi:hypothetical protein